MAKKKKINRSQAIRDILAKDPAAKPKAIQAGLAKKGIKVSASLINAVKYGKSKPGKRGGRLAHGRSQPPARLRSMLCLAQRRWPISSAEFGEHSRLWICWGG